MNFWVLVPLFAAALQGGPGAPTVSGSQLIREGRLREALEGYVEAAQASPKSVAANEGAGVVLDLLGRYEEARKYFTQNRRSQQDSTKGSCLDVYSLVPAPFQSITLTSFHGFFRSSN